MSRAQMLGAFVCATLTVLGMGRVASAEQRPLKGDRTAESGSTIDVPATDPEMIEAQVRARASLDRFWAVYANPRAGEEGFALKVAVPVRPGESEYLWTSDISRRDDKIFGRVSNAPKKAATVSAGQVIEIAPDQISDWMYLRNGRIVGNFTLRPLLQRMSPAEADRFRAMLAEP